MVYLMNVVIQTRHGIVVYLMDVVIAIVQIWDRGISYECCDTD